MVERPVPKDTEVAQANATDPGASAWVSANAGSGKTYVLAQRVIRLMLEGTPPSRILCLTFTNAAAAEMSNRVFEQLSKWTMADREQLETQIRKLIGIRPTNEMLRRSRQLFALALDTPGGLKIQTIHAFCESLLHQFPLEANVTGHFTILDDFTQDTLLEEARRSVFVSAQNSNAELAHAYEIAMEYGSDLVIEKAIKQLINNRSAFEEWVTGGIEGALRPVHKHLNLPENASAEEIYDQVVQYLSVPKSFWDEVIKEARSTEADNNIDQADKLFKIIELTPSKHWFLELEKFLLNKDGGARSRLFFKDFVKNRPDLDSQLKETQERFKIIAPRVRAWEMLRATKAIFQIAQGVLHRYKLLKRTQGLVDYNDMITEAANLLLRSDIRQWVQYKLDRGIDHVLVDEAQDTSPKQWEIINAVIEDYHAGETAGKKNRTVFVVGDEKQSIFSFQGAEPGAFNQQFRRLKRAVKSSESAFNDEKLRLSFRSTKAVISAVDRVFSVADNARGLSSIETSTNHETIRGNDFGEVIVWPLFEAQKVEKSTDWLPKEERFGGVDPAQSLANQISDDITNMIGTQLSGRENPVAYGDILVLVRKRDRFINILTKTFKERGFSIAGVDRLKLTDHIAVQDLLALAKFALMPEDDLSLACVLKSPIFSVGEDELFNIAHDRGSVGLYQHLKNTLEVTQTDPNTKLRSIVGHLEYYIYVARQTSVFGFFSEFLSTNGGRKSYLAKLGTEVEEILDAFLEAAMEHDHNDKRGLQEFVSKMQSASPEVKRQVNMERDEIRIMTVHSAKGLEASLVYLVDSCGRPFDGQHRSQIQETSLADGQKCYLWQATKEQKIPLTEQSLEKEKREAEEEYRRLLYVGMTRAADRLVVCGYKNANNITFDHWHSMVSNALADGSESLPFKGVDGDAIHWAAGRKDKESDDRSDVEKLPSTLPLPLWATTKSTHEAPIPQPLTATGAYLTFGGAEAQQYQEPPPKTSGQNANAALKGTLSHKLLQYLPAYPETDRPGLARSFLQRNKDLISLQEQEQIIDQVLAIVNGNQYQHLFQSNSKPEVSIVGSILVGGIERIVVGQIDRLAVGENEVTILDFKSGERVPQQPAQTPGAYLCQMAVYKQVLEQIHPEKRVKCGLLWTSWPKLMWIPDRLLAEAMEKINKG